MGLRYPPKRSWFALRQGMRSVLLFAVVSLLLTWSCSAGSSSLAYSDSAWTLVQGQEKAHLFTSGDLLGLSNPRVYTAPGNQEEIFLTEVLPDGTYVPGFTWNSEILGAKPKVWQVNLQSFATESISFEDFQTLASQAQADASEPTSLDQFPTLQLAGKDKLVFTFDSESRNQSGYQIAPDAPLTEELRSPELRVYANQARRYVIALSLSELSIVRQRQYDSRFPSSPLSGFKGWRTEPYYSGTMHLEVFDAAVPQQALIHLSKQFKNWGLLPNLLEFIEVATLPNGGPCLVLNNSLFVTQVKTSGLLIP
ncbi:hypothetical protein [Leptolyngbya sp. FACHB-261]|uniref:hypothetical protein n=1 Tax=Leptolyngbya sp. FACHB-261 TaxID=2692806 RepID=UPI0016888041|nr:hypothetical protein [Leptolyngbya sp. FACHB-261]MBD2101218.1 hypothetical protein [Leptolyngbya sp. FACHB-261]